MTKKEKYKRYVYAMSCILLAGGISKAIFGTVPDLKDDCAEVQLQINHIIERWDHIGTWNRTMKLVHIKIGNWSKKHIIIEKNMPMACLLGTVLGILVDLLPKLSYKEKGYINGLITAIENLLLKIENEDDDEMYGERCHTMIEGF